MAESRITRQLIEREQSILFWGQSHRITPRLVIGRFGNGKRLIGLAPLNTRPNYYVLRIDSRWKLSNWESGNLFADHLDAILSAIEDQFGNAHCGNCEERFGEERQSETDPLPGCDECRDRPASDSEFPALNEDSGCEWFELDRREVLEAQEAVAS